MQKSFAVVVGSILVAFNAAASSPIPLGRIAFSTTGNPYQIQIVDTSSGTISIVPLPGAIPLLSRPSWTPDDQWIVFAGGPGGNSQVYTVRPDGTGLRRITDGSGDLVEPAISPDGSRIAYHQVYGDAHVINLDGTSQRDLGFLLGDLSWSPDGGYLVGSDWAEGGGYNSDLWIYSFATGLRTKITNRPDGTAFTWPAWSPDGAHIAASFLTNNQWDIVVMNADGSGIANLTGDWPSDEYTPSWTPDGQFVLFASTHGGDQDIWAMKPDGTGRTNLTPAATQPESCPAMARLVNLNAGLVAYYPFNGNANDVVGTNNGIVYGGVTPTQDRFGNPSSACHFDGATGYIWIGTGLRPSNITACVWFRTTPDINGLPPPNGTEMIIRDRLYYSVIGIDYRLLVC